MSGRACSNAACFSSRDAPASPNQFGECVAQRADLRYSQPLLADRAVSRALWPCLAVVAKARQEWGIWRDLLNASVGCDEIITAQRDNLLIVDNISMALPTFPLSPEDFDPGKSKKRQFYTR